MKKLVCVLFITLALPVFGALTVERSNHASPFVAYAGRSTVGGGACSCGDPDCITEPGECPRTNGATSDDGGAGLLLMLFAVGFALRIVMRQ